MNGWERGAHRDTKEFSMIFDDFDIEFMGFKIDPLWYYWNIARES